MTLNLIPGRVRGRHRGKSGLQLQKELDAAERKVASLTAGMDQKAAECNDLAGQLDAARIALAAAGEEVATLRPALEESRAKHAAAEELVVQQQADLEELVLERDGLRDEVLMFRARFGPQLAAEANANAVTVPPMVRPIDGPEEEATAPIDVRPLWAARDAGLLGPVTDPGQVTTR